MQHFFKTCCLELPGVGISHVPENGINYKQVCMLSEHVKRRLYSGTSCHKDEFREKWIAARISRVLLVGEDTFLEHKAHGLFCFMGPQRYELIMSMCS